MAYILGFFAADGSMLKNGRGAHFIEFHITDREVIYSIRDVLGSEHKVTARNRNVKWKTLYRLQIGSKEMYRDLAKLGFMQAKSKKMKLPVVPPVYFADFVRGYFDGDGCVYFKKHKVKARKNKKWVFSSRFTSGSENFLKELHKSLQATTIDRGFIVKKKKKGEINGYELVFSHRDSLALFKYMYNNSPCNLFLKRKYVLFKKAVETLYGVECSGSSTG